MISNVYKTVRSSFLAFRDLVRDRREKEEKLSAWRALDELMAWLADHGHKTDEVINWIDMDDSSGYAKCSCGWSSRSAKVNWIDTRAREHAIKIAEEMDLPRPMHKRLMLAKTIRFL